MNPVDSLINNKIYLIQTRNCSKGAI